MTRDQESDDQSNISKFPKLVLLERLTEVILNSASRTPRILVEIEPLTDKERQVLNRKLGINGETASSIRRIANDLEIPKSTVFDIGKRAKAKLHPKVHIRLSSDPSK